MICEACQNIFRGGLQLFEGAEPGSYVSDRRIHHMTIQDLDKAVIEEHCQICVLIWGEVVQDTNLEACPIFTEYGFHQRNGVRTLGFLKSGANVLRVVLVPLKASFSSHFRSTLHQVHIADNTASIQSFSQARSWISTCLEHHRDCGRSTSRALYQYYPTRLLDLQPYRSRTDIELRLCTTHKDPPETPYMTLSHCWGTLKCLTLTTLNYKDLETGFKLIELPKTFREAIEITRNLGIRYLWIDALCILQDSHKDWRHEAATMMKVYENSYCNISALAATNSEQGCFFKRPPWCISRTIVETSWDNELNASYDIYPEYFWPVFVDAAPLNSRAWVFQERLLAPRILHYGRNQLFWECLELDACETYPDGLPCTDTVPHSNYRDVGTRITGRWKGVDLDTQALRERFALEPGERSLMYKYWHKLVEVYSSRNLTRAEDKLVAISGLAKRVQSCLDDEYLAGLWKGSLPLDLLWYPHWMDGCPRRSSSYRAPTWSWASIERGAWYETDGELSFERLVDLGAVVPVGESSQASAQISPRPRRHKEKALEPLIHPVTILATGVDSATTDVTGQVTYAFIRLTGSLIPARIEFHPSEVHVEKRFTVHLQMSPYKETSIFPDIDLRTMCGRAGIFFLPIHAFIRGLLLELVDPVNQFYERIGLLEIWRDRYEYDTEGKDSSCHPCQEEFKEQVLTLI